MNKTLTIFILFFNLTANQLFCQIEETKDSSVSVSFSVVGDLIVHGQQLRSAKVDSVTYDFNPPFSVIKPFLQSPDFTMGNLEVVLGGTDHKYSGYPRFNTPDSFADALKETGFDFLFTANNHSVDYGKNGLTRTIEQLNKRGLNYSGTFNEDEERDSIKIYDIKGITFTILSYSYLLNRNIEPGSENLINIIKLGQIRKDVLRAKTKELDLVIVYLHFGNEYDRYPSEYQNQTVNSVQRYGADIILASHTHTVQPVQMYKPRKSKLDSGFVAYGLGNFISNQRWRYSDAGVILNFSVEKNINDGKISLSELSFIPTWVFKGYTNNGLEYIILPSEYSEKDSQPPYLTEEDKILMKQSYYDTIEVVTDSTSSIKFKSVLKE